MGFLYDDVRLMTASEWYLAISKVPNIQIETCEPWWTADTVGWINENGEFDNDLSKWQGKAKGLRPLFEFSFLKTENIEPGDRIKIGIIPCTVINKTFDQNRGVFRAHAIPDKIIKVINKRDALRVFDTEEFRSLVYSGGRL